MTKLIVALRYFTNAPKNERTNIVPSIVICVLLLLCLLLLLALQPTMGFSLLSDPLPFCSFFTFLSPPSYSHYLHIFFDIYNTSLPWSPSNSRTYMFSIVMSMYCYCIFIVPAGTLRLPWLRFFRAVFSVVRQKPGYNPQRRGTARALPKFLCCSIYCLLRVVLCIICV
jgi:hypothetical protein